MKTKISLVIPAYNAEKTISKALDSLLKQTIDKEKVEIIVVNDGSTDGTGDVLLEYSKRFPNFKIINQENKGALAAANIGFKEAKGDYVIKLDADDYFEREILQKLANELDKNNDIDFVYSDYYEIGLDNKKIIVDTSKNLFNCVAIGIIFRKKVLERFGFYDENIFFSEYDLLCKLLEKGHKGKHISELLFTYVRRKDSITTNNVERVKEGVKEIYRLHKEIIDRENLRIRDY